MPKTKVMIREIEFQQAYERVLPTLVQMKLNLDNYRAREKHSEGYAEKREKELLLIGKFVEASIRFVQELQEETGLHYKAGFEKGKEWSPHPQHGYRSDIYNVFDVLRLMKLDEKQMVQLAKQIRDKRVIRKLSKIQTKIKWPELY